MARRRTVYPTLDHLDRIKAMMLGLPIKRISSWIPFGYVGNTEDDWLTPVDDQLQLLWKAKGYLTRGHSFAKVADWLSSKSGETVSASGLQKLVKTRPPLREVFLPLEERERLFNIRHDIYDREGNEKKLSTPEKKKKRFPTFKGEEPFGDDNEASV